MRYGIYAATRRGQSVLSIQNDETGEEIGRVIVKAGEPGPGRIRIEVERQDESATGPVEVIVR